LEYTDNEIKYVKCNAKRKSGAEDN